MRRIEARRKNASAFLEILPILDKPSTAIEPGNGALDDPAFGQDRKSADAIGALDDFNVEMRKNFCKRFRKFWSLISAVGEQRLQKWKCRTVSPSRERLHRDLECRPDER